MQDEEWELIRRNLVFLRDTLNIDVVCLYLYQEHVINDDEEKSLSAITNKNDRSIALLRLLRTKPNGYIALLNALICVQPDIVNCLLPTSPGNDRSTHHVDNLPPPAYSSRSCNTQSSDVSPPSYEQSMFISGSPSYSRSNDVRTNSRPNQYRPSAATQSHQIPVSRTIHGSESVCRSGSFGSRHNQESQHNPANWTIPSNVSVPRIGSTGSRNDSHQENCIHPSAPPIDKTTLSPATSADVSDPCSAPHIDVQSSDYNLSRVPNNAYYMSADQVPQWTEQEATYKHEPIDQASRCLDDHGTGSLSSSRNSLETDQHLDEGEGQSHEGLEEISFLVKELYKNDFNSRRIACRQLLLNSVHQEKKRAVVKAGGMDALLDIIKMEKDEPLLEYATGVLWNLSASAEFMDALLYKGLAVLVENAIVPFEKFSRNDFIFRNAVGIIRNISTASLNDVHNGWETRNKLRKHEGLVKSIVQFLRTSINNCDLETKTVENILYVLRNLSYRIQEIFDKDYDAKPLPHEEEESKEAGITKMFSRLFTIKSKETKDKATPFISETVNRHCQDLVDRSVQTIYIRILSDCNKTVIACAALKALTGLMQCNWCYAVELREYFRKDKGLPITVELLIQEDSRIVDHSAELMKYLTLDSANGKLIGKFGMKQMISILPKTVSHKKYSDHTICHILSTFDNIFRQNPKDEFLERSFVQEGGADPLKLIKFVDGVYLQSTKHEAQKVLELLWKVSSLHSVYESHGLRKHDITSPIAV